VGSCATANNNEGGSSGDSGDVLGFHGFEGVVWLN
jgi:hypothetical protein